MALHRGIEALTSYYFDSGLAHFFQDEQKSSIITDQLKSGLFHSKEDFVSALRHEKKIFALRTIL